MLGELILLTFCLTLLRMTLLLDGVPDLSYIYSEYNKTLRLTLLYLTLNDGFESSYLYSENIIRR